MMFYAFGGAIVLAAFAVVDVVVSVAVMVLALPAARALAPLRTTTRTRALLAIRLAPPVAAAVFAFGLVLPAYLLFEPAQSGERVTPALAVLAAAALALVGHGLLRGARALSSTSALQRRWMAQAEPIAATASPVPVYRVRDAFPVFTVVGLRRPSMYVSGRVLDALAPSEIAAAMAHERGHLDGRDNVKRLLLCACPDLVAFTPVSRAIEQEWVRAAEMLADERASGGCRETALALAAGLVKVARLAPMTGGGLPVSALHDGDDVSARVRHLVADADRRVEGARRGRAFVILTGAVLGASGLALASQALPAVHELIEVGARLLR
jgi:Zn-dependent protease with chaperone function